jgi:hypothetical protein
MVKNAHRPTCLKRYIGTHRNNMQDRHTILRVITQDGHAFAIDGTAAQFGWAETIAPWEIYSAQRVQHFSETIPFETFVDIFENTTRDSNDVSGEARLKISKSLEGIVNDWLKEKALTPTQLLDLSNDEYALQEESLMAAVRDGVEESVGALRRRGLYHWFVKRIPNSEKGPVSLTLSRREYKKARKNWVTDKQYMQGAIKMCKLKGTKFGLAGVAKKW